MSKKVEPSDNVKYVVAHCYFIGMSKENIYKTMNKNGIKVTRSFIKSYLKPHMYHVFKGSNYVRRYKKIPKSVKAGFIHDKKAEQDRMNKQFLQFVLITGLNHKEIQYQDEFKGLVKYNDFFKTWGS